MEEEVPNNEEMETEDDQQTEKQVKVEEETEEMEVEEQTDGNSQIPTHLLRQEQNDEIKGETFPYSSQYRRSRKYGKHHNQSVPATKLPERH